MRAVKELRTEPIPNRFSGQSVFDLAATAAPQKVEEAEMAIGSYKYHLGPSILFRSSRFSLQPKAIRNQLIMRTMAHVALLRIVLGICFVFMIPSLTPKTGYGQELRKETANVLMVRMDGTKFPPQQLDNLTIEGLFQEAGLRVNLKHDDTCVFPNQPEVSAIELAEIVKTYKQKNNLKNGDQAYVILGSKLKEREGVYGLMFDSESGDIDNYPREACAAFYRAHEKDFPRSLDSELFLTTAHELGHVFNLHHNDWEGLHFTSGGSS